MTNPLIELHTFGQSFWYDNIQRKFLQDGTLQALIDQDGLRGMTSNPAIFRKAIGNSTDYDEQLNTLISQGFDATVIYEQIALADIQAACDLFADLYQQSNGEDGYVSLEVSPSLANDTQGTVMEAHRLFAKVNRPNLMIKVPATDAGIPAIRQLISAGININITLMFNMAHYEAVAQAYIDGLMQRLNRGGDINHIASVASFFVSRVDTAVDDQLNALNSPPTKALLGKVAIANCKVVYQRFKEIFHGEPFAKLQAAGAKRQRLLWASTGTKNPNYSDVLYIDNLIGSETVNTMPPHTVEAFRDHGTPANTLDADVAQAKQVLDNLDKLGIHLHSITQDLQTKGVHAFIQSFNELLAVIQEKAAMINNQDSAHKKEVDMNQNIIMGTLATTDIFDNFGRVQLELIANICEPIDCKKGKILFEEGSLGKELYIIQDGTVEIVVSSGHGSNSDEEVVLTEFRRGQVLGEVALVDQGMRTATARASARKTKLLRIERERLMKLCDSYPELGYKLMRNLAGDLALKIRQTDLTIKQLEKMMGKQ